VGKKRRKKVRLLPFFLPAEESHLTVVQGKSRVASIPMHVSVGERGKGGGGNDALSSQVFVSG